MRTALIAGASGLVGGHCLDLLLAEPAYDSVTALVRRELPATHRKLRQVVVDFDRLGEKAALFDVDDLFCCLGTTIRAAGSQEAFRKVDHDYPMELGRLLKEHGGRQMAIVSSLGADPGSRFFYNRVKGEVEEGLGAMGLPALQIFRPSLLLGERSESRLGEKIGSVVMKLVGPLLVGSLRKYRGIRGADVARAMVRVALAEPSGRHIYESDRIAAIAEGGVVDLPR